MHWPRLPPSGAFLFGSRIPRIKLSPPHIDPKDRPLRRKVALAYRTAREAGKSHDRAFDAAMTVYLEARPDEKADQIAVSEKVAVMISSRRTKPGSTLRSATTT
jgi:hypothetical protein